MNVRREWQLQKAKAEFSKVIEQCQVDGPQVVTKHGLPTAVVVSMSDFKKLSSKSRSFKEFLRSAHLAELDIERQRSTDRRVDL